MKPDLQRKLDHVRDALHQAGKDLPPADWKALLEELDADIDGHLDAISEEGEG